MRPLPRFGPISRPQPCLKTVSASGALRPSAMLLGRKRVRRRNHVGVANQTDGLLEGTVGFLGDVARMRRACRAAVAGTRSPSSRPATLRGRQFRMALTGRARTRLQKTFGQHHDHEAARPLREFCA